MLLRKASFSLLLLSNTLSTNLLSSIIMHLLRGNLIYCQTYKTIEINTNFQQYVNHYLLFSKILFNIQFMLVKQKMINIYLYIYI